MKIGIIIAVPEELQAFLEKGNGIIQETLANKPLYRTTMDGHEICAMLSGWGEIDAAATTQLLITVLGCEAILNFGVTGALIPSLKVEDLFVVRGALHYQYDVSPIDPVKPHQYAEFGDEFIPLDANLRSLAVSRFPSLMEARVASGDRFVEDREEKKNLAALGCQICDMEIAAIARICALNGIPCLSIKCISDTFDGTGEHYVQNVKTSAEKAFRVLREVIAAL